MNNAISLIDVRIEAMDAIRKLKSKELDVKTASEIRDLLSVIVDTAKTQVEFMKAIPTSLKEKMSEETIRCISGAIQGQQAEPKKDKLGLFGNPYEAIAAINKENE
jgi:hypothetical protein